MTTAAPALRALPAELAARPRAVAVAGALTIAFSSILVRLSDTTPSTSAVFRCLYALPVLAVLAWREDRRLGPRPASDRRLALAAGVFLGLDLLFWHRAIADIGAGLGTVLANLQVAAVPLLAWAVLGERPARRLLAMLPVVIGGIVLISGALEHGAYGVNPARGALLGIATGVAYSAYLLVQRQGSMDLRRPAGALFEMSLVAAAISLGFGLVIGVDDLAPTWPSAGWLITLALTSQVVGWLLITFSLPRLPAALTSMILTIQPIASVALGAVLLGQEPSALQLCGVAFILGGVISVAVRRAPARTAG